jgi:hypothetical protein
MLEKTVARGTEPDCYRCGKAIKPYDIIVKKPSDRPAGFRDTESVGGKGYVWVHEKCSPLKSKVHRPGKRKKR